MQLQLWTWHQQQQVPLNYVLSRVADADKSKRLLAQMQKQLVDLLHANRAQVQQLGEELRVGACLLEPPVLLLLNAFPAQQKRHSRSRKGDDDVVDSNTARLSKVPRDVSVRWMRCGLLGAAHAVCQGVPHSPKKADGPKAPRDLINPHMPMRVKKRNKVQYQGLPATATQTGNAGE